MRDKNILLLLQLLLLQLLLLQLLLLQLLPHQREVQQALHEATARTY